MNKGRELRNSLKKISVTGLRSYVQSLKKSAKDFHSEMKNLYPTAIVWDNTSRYLKIAKSTLDRKMKRGDT